MNRRHHTCKSNIDGLEIARLLYGPGRDERAGEPKSDASPLEAAHGFESEASTATANQESNRD